MSGLEVNKIIASFIIAIIIIGIISFLGNLIIDQNTSELAENAYIIEIDESEESMDVASLDNSKINEPISMLLASASSEKGEKLFKKCSACHTYKKDGAGKVGPNLWDIVNRAKADVVGFNYSKDLAEFGGKWGFEELNQFLYKPKEYIPGTKMNFSGLKKIEDRANLVLFLREQSDNPVALP